MQKSTEIMKLSNQLVKLPEVSAIMRQMSAEMTKVSILPPAIHLMLFQRTNYHSLQSVDHKSRRRGSWKN